MTITPGRIVLYRLNSFDAETINKRRADAAHSMGYHQAQADGSQVHVGNEVRSGEVFPFVVTRVWSAGYVNGQVLLDGNDTLWVTSVAEGEGERCWAWPERVPDPVAARAIADDLVDLHRLAGTN